MPEKDEKKTKLPRKVRVSNPRSRTAHQLFKKFLYDMANPPQVQPTLLAGDPGSGKTSFVQAMALALDVGLVVIEAPHTSPDHVAPIPYYIYREGKLFKKDVSATQQSPEVKLAKPKLLTDLMQEYRRWANRQYNEKRVFPLLQQRFGPHWVEMVKENFDLVQEARERYKLIMFLDEFYRVNSPQVANILRNLALDRQIHGTPLAKGVYVILATNLGDVGVEEIPDHHTFVIKELSYTPDELKDYWLSSLGVSKDVAEAVLNVATNENGELITGRDTDTDTFASNRRLTHFALILDEAIRSGDPEAARLAATLAHSNFYDPQHEAEHPLGARLSKLVADKLGNPEPFSHKEWQKALEIYIKMVERLGPKYKHTLNIYGPPGVGKSAVLTQLSQKLGAKGVVRIAVPELNPEATVGIPNVDPNSGETSFDNPMLFDKIRKELDLTDEELRKAREGCPDEEEGEKKVKYIVFLDEISRPQSPKVFNFIRRMLLDKQVNDDPRTRLPCGTLVVTAMNPFDESGAVEELSMHVKDVLDFIPSGVDTAQFVLYMRNKFQQIGPWAPNLFELLLNVLRDVSPGEDAQGKIVPSDERPFWQGTKGNVVWFPPRLIDSITKTFISGLGAIIKRLKADGTLSPERPIEEQREAIKEAIRDADLLADFASDVGSYLAARVGSAVGDGVMMEIIGILNNRLDEIIDLIDLRSVEGSPDLISIFMEFEKSPKQAGAGARQVKAAGTFINLQTWAVQNTEAERMAQINQVLDLIAQMKWPDAGIKAAEFFTEVDRVIEEVINDDTIVSPNKVTPAFREAMWQTVDQGMIRKAYKDATAETLSAADSHPTVANKYLPRVDEYRRDEYAIAIRMAFFEAYEKGSTFEGVPVDIKRVEELFGIKIAEEEETEEQKQ